jgi:hypothetical protein
MMTMMNDVDGDWWQALMIKRELAKDPQLATENWDRFLPKFKKNNVKKKAAKPKREKKEYTPFPPAQQPRYSFATQRRTRTRTRTRCLIWLCGDRVRSKLDMQLESGEYWLTEAEKKKQKDKEKAQKKWEAKMQKKAEREKAFVAPKEEPKKKEAQKEETTMELAAKVKQQHVRFIPQFSPFSRVSIGLVMCVSCRVVGRVVSLCVFWVRSWRGAHLRVRVLPVGFHSHSRTRAPLLSSFRGRGGREPFVRVVRSLPTRGRQL